MMNFCVMIYYRADLDSIKIFHLIFFLSLERWIQSLYEDDHFAITFEIIYMIYYN